MTSGLLGIGLSGLNAAQAGLLATSNNVSNVNTAGYSRETVIQSESPSTITGAGFVGEGVNVDSISRVYSSFLQQELVQTQATSSQSSTDYAQMQQVDNLLGNPTSGLGASISSFFSAAQALATNPSDSATRQTFLSSLQTTVTSFNTTGQQLAQIGSSLNQQLTTSIQSVNSITSQIAQLNQAILNSQGASANAKPANNLLDQRDQLISQLNQQIGTSSITQSDGTVDLFVGNGQPLVLGNQANALAAVTDATDPANLDLKLQDGKTTISLQSSSVTGGAIGGLLSFRDQSLVPTQNALGQLAIGFASAINQQNELGQDANGVAGQALLSVPGPTVIAGTGNTGTGQLGATITQASSLTSSDYRLAYNGTQYTLTSLSDGSSQSFASLPQSVDGMTLSLTGSMASGDSFTIQPTRYGSTGISVTATDPAKVAAAAPVAATLGVQNMGDLAVSSLSVNGPPPTNANLKDTMAMTFHVSGGNTTYDLVDSTNGTTIASGATYSPGMSITANGWTLSLSGSPSNGDTLSIGANSSGAASDNRNALLMAGLQTSTTVAGTNLGAAYASILSTVGARTASMQTISTTQSNMLSQAQQTRDSTSGVNLNEEAANLMQYQQAYQAASKTIATANTLFQSILALFN